MIVDAKKVDRFVIVEKEDAVLIVASYCINDRPVTLAKYRDFKEAKTALGDMLGALASENLMFYMPPSLLFDDKKLKHDARTKRRGGS